MTAVLRAIALMVAVAGVVDPAVEVLRPRPVRVEVLAGPGREAGDLAGRLRSALSDVEFVDRGGDARVFVDREPPPALLSDGVPVSAIKLPDAPNVRVLGAAAPTLVAGRSGLVTVTVEARGVSGLASAVVIEQDGVELGRAEQRWSAAGRHQVLVPLLAPSPGEHFMRVSVASVPAEVRLDDNAIDVAVRAAARPVRVAFVETRPSWSAAFVRRALERDPAFAVHSLIRASRGIAVRTGDVPAVLTATSLEPFDAVAVGAPEDLTRRELDALGAFAADRGGRVVMLPDRRPTGPYAAWLSPHGFDEVLLDTPARVVAARSGLILRAAELAVPRARDRVATAVAALEDGRPAVLYWPRGLGAVVFAGTLDAWRYRGADDTGHADFWRGLLASEGLAAPPRLAVSVEPAVAAPGVERRVVVRLRPTEFESAAGGVLRMPPVRAEARSGERAAPAQPIRLWPAGEVGVYAGTFRPAGAGPHRVHVTAGAAESVAAVLTGEIGSPVGASAEMAALAAAATGGVHAADGDLAPVVAHLQAIDRAESAATVRPLRSGWWIAPFALALCAEWALRRRRGQR